ncbi:MAG: hypothetical protein JSV80_09850 [Acidobacteriota bacterium]|nr:MAG: hypothetical protein JSV80_09850 [Acidobacteriota bacterium]
MPALLDGAISEPGRRPLEYRMIAAYGKAVWLRNTLDVVEPPGQPARLRGVMIDISAQKALERALAVSQQQCRLLSVKSKTINERRESELEQRERSLRDGAAVDELLTSISTKMIQQRSSEVDAGIADALERVARFTDADRACNYLCSDDATSLQRSHEWCADGVAPLRERAPHNGRSRRSTAGSAH